MEAILDVIQVLLVGVAFFLGVKTAGKLFSLVNELKTAIEAIEPPSKCKFYPQEMPTVKEVHKIVEKTTQQEFMGQQYERIRMKHNQIDRK